MSKSIIIIGAGIAGLSAGSYGQMNGFSTRIFEMHDRVGGLCTSWKRKDYYIDGCIHGLLGSSPTNPYYRMWNELLDMSQLEFYNAETEDVIEFEDGERFTVYSDISRLERQMMETAPEDARVIDDFIRSTRNFQKFTIPIDLPSIVDMLKMISYLPALLSMRRWLKTSSDQFARRFSNPFMRRAMRHLISPVLFQMLVIYAMDLQVSGYPVCGSGQFARLIKKRYLSLGGKINYKSPVAQILVEDGCAVGIELENGEQHLADIVISAADGRATIFGMLSGKYAGQKLSALYDIIELNPSRVHISLGVNEVFEDFPFKIKYVLKDGQLFTQPDGTSYPDINVLTYTNMPDIVPEGKSLLRIELETRNDEYWTSLREKDRKGYLEQKNKVAQDIIDFLDGKIPGLREKIEMTDVATPATYIRYTGNWRGSIQGWENSNIFRRNPFKKTLPGLQNFFMCGQWVEPGGGVPSAALSGRKLIRLICKKHGKRFFTNTF